MKPSRCDQMIVAVALLSIGCNKHPGGNLPPLHQAARNGSAGQIQTLLAGGARIETEDKSTQELLADAVRNGHADVARILLDHGADPNGRGYEGETPLHAAISWGKHRAVVDLLLSRCVDVNARDRYDRTPLHEAVVGGHPRDVIRPGDRQITEMLLARGADVNA